MGLPGSGQFPHSSSADSLISTAETSLDPNILERIAENRLKTSSLSTAIRLRLPNISLPVRIALDLNRTLVDVRNFLNENVPSLQSNRFEFMKPPSTKINYEEEKCKICDTNLSNSTLIVRLVV